MDKPENFSRTFITLLENSTDFLYFKDSDHRFTAVSTAFANLTGHNHWSEMIGKCDQEIFPKQHAELYYQSDLAVMNTGIPLKNKREPYQTPEGDIGWVDTHKWPIKNEKGNTIGLFGLSRDISQLVKAEEKLKKQEKNLIEAINTKDKLFSIIAHDLRSPFNNILGFSELLIENVNDDTFTQSEKYLNIINSSANNTLILLDNLLNWAKSQTGKISFNPVKLSFSNIIMEVFKIKEPIAKAKNISLSYCTTDEIEVYADENMLKIILRNLISNAIKFTKHGGEVRVSAVLIKDWIEVTISDNGVGMKEEKRKELFKISSNSSTVGTANEKGSGLGLLLCKEFIEKHQGEIWVESIEGKGSEFKFTVPSKELYA